MKKVLFPATAALALGFALACGGSSTTTPPPPPPPSTTAAAGSVGVPECDDYITKMEACMSSMDPAMKSQYESAFKSTRDAWTQAAATPQGKEGLKIGCQSALTSMPSTCGSSTAVGTAPATGTATGTTTAAGTAPVAGTAPIATTPTATTTPETPDTPQGDFRTNKKSPSLQDLRNERH